MAAYTARQYRLQDDVMSQVRWAGINDRCPVCRVRRRGTWPSGVKRTTCGDQRCFIQWLPVRGLVDTPEAEADDE